MDGEDEIFREIILDHHERPRNRGALAGATHEEWTRNPETGDEVKLSAIVDAELIQQIHFEAQGSAVFVASCSLMTVFAKGKSFFECKAGAELFLRMLENPDSDLQQFAELGDILALSGIRHLPARVACAALPWRSLLTLIEQK